MPAKKSTPKPAAEKAAAPAPAKKAPAKKAAAKKATKTVAKKAVKTVAKKSTVKKSPNYEAIAEAAYLNYRRRMDLGLPGDHDNDWLEAERSLGI
jgi:hypothetical protein